MGYHTILRGYDAQHLPMPDSLRLEKKALELTLGSQIGACVHTKGYCAAACALNRFLVQGAIRRCGGWPERGKREDNHLRELYCA